MKIIIANISIISKCESKIEQSITKQDLLIHITNEYFRIFSNNGVRPILNIKEPIFLEKTNNFIKIKNKNYVYEIYIHHIHNQMEYKFDNNNKSLKIKEKNVKEKVINNFNFYFPELKLLKTEYVTPYGNIDILAIDKYGFYNIIELKKKSTDFNTIDQVVKYGKYFEEIGKDTKLYVLGINNKLKNKIYAEDNNVKILELGK